MNTRMMMVVVKVTAMMGMMVVMLEMMRVLAC